MSKCDTCFYTHFLRVFQKYSFQFCGFSHKVMGYFRFCFHRPDFFTAPYLPYEKKAIFYKKSKVLILKVEHKSFLMMYHLSYLDIKHGIQRGGVNLTPPSVSWFSSTPAGIGLKRFFVPWTSIGPKGFLGLSKKKQSVGIFLKSWNEAWGL